MSCSGEGCNSIYIQNKKYNLCGDCVFKKNNGGKSKQEVYAERAKNRQGLNNEIQYYNIAAKEHNDKNYHVDEVSAMNARNQDAAEEAEKIDQGFGNIEGFLKQTKKEDDTYRGILFGDPKPEKKEKKKSTALKRQSVKKISGKQGEINRAYALTCADMDYTTEPVCTGCLQYQGGDIKLSHSHIISREDCKRIGREDLISDRENITYHCMDFGENKGCHGKWENPVLRSTLEDYENNIQYIKKIDEGLYLKYSSCI